jgi:hypothetical protein
MKQCYYCGRSDGRHDGACTPVAVELDEWTTVDPEHALPTTLSVGDLKKMVDEVEAKCGKLHRSCDWGSTPGFSSVSWHTMNRSILMDAEELRDHRMEDVANRVGEHWASRMNKYMIEVAIEWIG